MGRDVNMMAAGLGIDPDRPAELRSTEQLELRRIRELLEAINPTERRVAFDTWWVDPGTVNDEHEIPSDPCRYLYVTGVPGDIVTVWVGPQRAHLVAHTAPVPVTIETPMTWETVTITTGPANAAPVHVTASSDPYRVHLGDTPVPPAEPAPHYVWGAGAVGAYPGNQHTLGTAGTALAVASGAKIPYGHGVLLWLADATTGELGSGQFAWQANTTTLPNMITHPAAFAQLPPEPIVLWTPPQYRFMGGAVLHVSGYEDGMKLYTTIVASMNAQLT